MIVLVSLQGLLSRIVRNFRRSSHLLFMNMLLLLLGMLLHLILLISKLQGSTIDGFYLIEANLGLFSEYHKVFIVELTF